MGLFRVFPVDLSVNVEGIVISRVLMLGRFIGLRISGVFHFNLVLVGDEVYSGIFVQGCAVGHHDFSAVSMVLQEILREINGDDLTVNGNRGVICSNIRPIDLNFNILCFRSR